MLEFVMCSLITTLAFVLPSDIYVMAGDNVKWLGH